MGERLAVGFDDEVLGETGVVLADLGVAVFDQHPKMPRLGGLVGEVAPRSAQASATANAWTQHRPFSSAPATTPVGVTRKCARFCQFHFMTGHTGLSFLRVTSLTA
jgi:hypothetical protein